MDQSESNPPPVTPMWSELYPDLLRSVFQRLSFTNLKRAKSVCRSWNSASRSCVPKRNQIPWLILFPQQNQTNSNNSCVLFVPDGKDNLYKTRDLGAEFTRSCCLASYGSWLLMFDQSWNLYIVNPLTLEIIDLPHSSLSKEDITRQPWLACLWVDKITKNYLVVWILHDRMVYTRKGDGRWRRTTSLFPAARVAQQIIHNSKDHKVYIAPDISLRVFVWDFSDDIPRQNGYILPFYVGRDALVDGGTIDWGRGYYFRRMIATSVSGQVLLVACMEQDSIWEFRIYAYDPLTKTGERVNDLGDEALILDMGFTVVVAKDIPGIKRNSIYFSYFNIDHQSKDPEHIFVYDLHTRTTERLPQWVVSSVGFSDARWFFPDTNH
ncbi:PREDICTED: putative F-box protein At4g17565 [Brassica oleracea var. oleracea]|uniref:putative F-box protein At4g17565 n=1 Tax=Brassica oleracea var. oleracea TaxID=109376 RepID=UPI0006A701A1|nr:PREDICTED: putative F-box protein At4g17565 [Brassica oleracea var. oleracea]